MAQHESPSDGPASPSPPPWMRRTATYAPERRARMLEHMARARSAPQPQATVTPEPARPSGWAIIGDAWGHAVLFGILALLFGSPVPLYLGAFIFLTDGDRIENALRTIGMRFEPETIGPDIIKSAISLFGWLALLISLRPSVPAWLAAWLPPADASWSFIAGIALALATIEACATLAMRRALPWLGVEIKANSLTCSAIKLATAIAVLALLVLLAAV